MDTSLLTKLDDISERLTRIETAVESVPSRVTKLEMNQEFNRGRVNVLAGIYGLILVGVEIVHWIVR